MVSLAFFLPSSLSSCPHPHFPHLQPRSPTGKHPRLYSSPPKLKTSSQGTSTTTGSWISSSCSNTTRVGGTRLQRWNFKSTRRTRTGSLVSKISNLWIDAVFWTKWVERRRSKGEESSPSRFLPSPFLSDVDPLILPSSTLVQPMVIDATGDLKPDLLGFPSANKDAEGSVVKLWQNVDGEYRL